MKLISLDASGTGVAVGAIESTEDSVRVIAALRLDDERSLSRAVPAVFEELLHSAGWQREQVTALAVGTGPGSWTSLRIALATMKTWAQTQQIPLMGIPSYDALALAAFHAVAQQEDLASQTLLLACGVSRANEIYAKLFVASPEGLAVAQAERICSPREALDTAAVEAISLGLDSPLILCGQGAAVTVAAAAEGDVIAQVDVPAEYVAMHVGLLAAQNLESGESGDPLAVEPLYLAPSAAERNLRPV